MIDQLLVTTTEDIPSRKCEIIGKVFGITIQSENVLHDLGAGLKSIVDGGIRAYTSMLTESGDQTINRLCGSTANLGTDAAVMMRFDSRSITGDVQSVVAYGTAVKFID